MSITPPDANGAAHDRKLGNEELKTIGREAFSEDVGNLIMSRQITNFQYLAHNFFTDVVIVHFNMTSSSVKNMIGGQRDVLMLSHQSLGGAIER